MAPAAGGGTCGLTETDTDISGPPRGRCGEAPPANAGDAGLMPGWGRSPGEGKGNSLQYSCLEDRHGQRAWWAPVHGVTKQSDTTERARVCTHTHTHTHTHMDISASTISLHQHERFGHR